MKAQEDIERQLAAAQDAWETVPAPELWDRLEQRLDEHTPANKPRMPRSWPFRIVTIALLASASLGMWWALSTGNAAIPVGKAFTLHDSNSGQLSMPMKLHDQQTTASPEGLNLAANAPEPSDLGPKSIPATVSSEPAVATMNPAIGLYDGSTSAASPTYNGNFSTTNMSGISAQGPMPIVPRIEAFNHSFAVSNSFGNPIDTVSSLAQYRSLIVPNDNAFLQLNVSTNQMNFNYENPVRAANNRENLQHLKWLLGNWKTQGTSGGAMEEWRQKDDFTMLGRGYFVVNGDTIVTEEMRIEQRGPNIYFIIVKDQNHRTMKFRLRSRQPNELIFQNDSPQSEEELVLRNRPGTDEIERILQDSPSNPSLSKSNPKETRVMQRKQP